MGRSGQVERTPTTRRSIEGDLRRLAAEPRTGQNHKHSLSEPFLKCVAQNDRGHRAELKVC